MNLLEYFLANKLLADDLHYYNNHLGFNAIKYQTNPRLYNNATDTDKNTVSGAYFSNINYNYGFICDGPQRTDETITQVEANLLCQSVGFRKAEEGKGIGWFQKSKFL